MQRYRSLAAIISRWCAACVAGGGVDLKQSYSEGLRTKICRQTDGLFFVTLLNIATNAGDQREISGNLSPQTQSLRQKQADLVAVRVKSICFCNFCKQELCIP